MQTNLELKKTIKARLEGAGDIRAAMGINKLSTEAYNAYCNTLADEIGEMVRIGVEASLNVYRARRDLEEAMEARDLAAALTAKVELDKSQNALNGPWACTQSIGLSNGCRFRVAFARHDGEPVAAQFSPTDNEITLFILPLLQMSGYRLQDLEGKSEEELGALVNSLVKSNWDPTWNSIGTVSAPADESIFHEFRHAHDAREYPMLTTPRIAGLREKAAAAENAIQSKKEAFANEATRRVGEKFTRGEHIDADAEQKSLKDAMGVLFATLDHLPVEHFIRPQARQCRAFLKRLMGMFSERGAYAVVDLRGAKDKLREEGQPLNDETIEAAISPETQYEYHLHRWIERLYTWLGYLGSYSEINAHIAQFIPKFAMLRKTNATRLSQAQLKSELAAAIKAIGIIPPVPEKLEPFVSPENQELIYTTNEHLSKIIVKRLYVALDAANRIDIAPNDDCDTRMKKMAEYLETVA